MSFIYLLESCTLKRYTAATNGTKSVITIHVEVTDHSELGFMLRELAEIEAKQKAEKKAKPATKKGAPLAALPAPLKQIPHFREGGE